MSLACIWRRLEIISLREVASLKITELNRKLLDLNSYAASIADGTVSLNDLMHAPSSMFNRMSIFMTASDQAAKYGAQEKYAYMSQIPGAMPQLQNQQQQQQYAQLMFKNLYDQEREKFGKQEQKILSLEDTKIQQELARLKTHVELLDKEAQRLDEENKSNQRA